MLDAGFVAVARLRDCIVHPAMAQGGKCPDGLQYPPAGATAGVPPGFAGLCVEFDLAATAAGAPSRRNGGIAGIETIAAAARQQKTPIFNLPVAIPHAKAAIAFMTSVCCKLHMAQHWRDFERGGSRDAACMSDLTYSFM